MPDHRVMAEAGGEAAQERLGEGDFGQQDERLAAAAQCLGDCFEIDLGLARAGDSVEQEGRELRLLHRRDQLRRRLALRRLQRRRVVRRVGLREGIVERDPDRLDRAHLHESADDIVRDSGDKGEFAHQSLPFADPLQRLLPRFGQPLGQPSGRAIFGDGPPALERAGRGERHPQHGGDRREIIIRRPFDQPPQRLRQWWHVISVEKRAETIVAHFLGRQPVRFPDHAEHLPRPERRDDDRARLHLHTLRHPVIERPQSGIKEDQARTRHGL